MAGQKLAHQAAAGRPLLPAREIRSRYYLRFAVADRPGVLGQLMTVLGAHHTSVAAGRPGRRIAACDQVGGVRAS